MAALAVSVDGISSTSTPQAADASGPLVGASVVALAHVAGLTVFLLLTRAENKFSSRSAGGTAHPFQRSATGWPEPP
jgi:hypothetical protein